MQGCRQLFRTGGTNNKGAAIRLKEEGGGGCGREAKIILRCKRAN